MLSKLLAVFLSCLVAFIPSVVMAGQADPDDSLSANGRVMVIGKGEKTPFGGLLFDLRASLKLKLDKEFAEKKYQLQLDLQKKLITSEFTLKLGLLQTKHDSLQDKHTSLLKIKNEEITRLQELVKKSPNEYNHWWFVGGILAGCLLSIGVYYAAVKIGE
tara:strand:+ start:3144 stop:3623 length:480 start_codon:yes stop_codon:yes gene_type:complete